MHNVELKCADWSGSSLKYNAFINVKAVGIPQSRIIKQPIEVLGFGGNASFPLGYINLDLIIGPMWVVTRYMSLPLVPRIICHICLGLQTQGYPSPITNVSRTSGNRWNLLLRGNFLWWILLWWIGERWRYHSTLTLRCASAGWEDLKK